MNINFGLAAKFTFHCKEDGSKQMIMLTKVGEGKWIFAASGTFINEVSLLTEDAHDYYQFKWNHFNQVFNG